ncbi:hypothetical protein Gura_0138 [Geotalea uraniireducens Rf4]|uniref:Uncharacterized protein n=1 Tax=Geotalea uraniireducens (strain Rf4) TaxID=351605 RepID=A5GDJ5_GEOUR|nr:hypothetical protein Gura_0138 [Geotalea uraniireducens Rf4]
MRYNADFTTFLHSQRTLQRPNRTMLNNFKEKVDKAEKKINPGGERVTDKVVPLENVINTKARLGKDEKR